jgi:hypothetical protein
LAKYFVSLLDFNRLNDCKYTENNGLSNEFSLLWRGGLLQTVWVEPFFSALT